MSSFLSHEQFAAVKLQHEERIAIAIDPIAQRGLAARILPRTTGITPAQITISE
jgi:hypothetical protein